MSWLRDSVHSFTLPPPDNTACVTQFKETNYTLKEKSPGLKYTVSLIIDESEMLAGQSTPDLEELLRSC